MKAALAALAATIGLGAGGTVAIPLLVTASMSSSAGPQATTPPSGQALAEIPPFLLPHYQASPACDGLPWQAVAAVGWVESRHGGQRVNPDTGRSESRVDRVTGDTEPRIVGRALDGSAGVRAIPATPASTANTGDARWDRAVGPMQFLTSTFSAWAIDGSGDGLENPHNAYDAIATAGRLLCNGASQLVSLDAALRRYNNSSVYVADVVAKATAYGMAAWGGAPETGVDYTGAPVVAHIDVGAAIRFALAQLGKPYRWGATGPESYDCSGLTQAAYAAAGARIGRTTAQQIHDGKPVDWHAQPIQAGDLVFTPSGSRPLGHVGLAIGPSHWVVAPRSGDVVKIAPIPASSIRAVRRIVDR